MAINYANAVVLSEHPKLEKVAQELIAEGLYTRAELERVFAQANVQQSVLNAMQNPAEYKFTWGKYRKLFIQDDRIKQAVEFWHEYESVLSRAEREYGVPASIIVAIIGVESKFGKYKGKHKVLDSLVSLVVGFPRRSDFFAGELKHFLILTKENQMDSFNVMGSYAGAVGYPQFISSSYRAYAVDFSGDGKTDLINQPVDAIGSVANYFVENGWLTGQPVTSLPHENVPQAVIDKASNKRKVQYSAADLRTLGAPVSSSIPLTEKLGVLEMNINEVVPDDISDSTYIVRAGDTACRVAEKHKMPCRQLIELNKLDEKATIFRGQKLTVQPQVVATSTANNDAGKWQVSGNSAESVITENSTEEFRYFFTHENFYVITRYNQSVLYAMAVHDLSTAIAQEKQRQTVSSIPINTNNLTN